MTRYEWRTIRQEEMNEMRQRQIRLGKRRKKGRDEAFRGIGELLLGIGFVALAQFTEVADTGLVFMAVLLLVTGFCSIVSGTRRWIK
jgi:sulfite exporter TauE/SafE